MLERARELDAADTIAHFRDRFDLPEGVIYLDGNSLGPLPKASRERLHRVIDAEWGEGLIRSWNELPDGGGDWIAMPQRVGAKIAPLVGAQPHEVIACDSVSINLAKLIGAALSLNPGRNIVLSEPGNFPTDLYMIQGQPQVEQRLADRDKMVDALDESVALLLLTHVHYKTGEMFDMERLTKAAHDVGAIVLWDLSHSGGAVPVDQAAALPDGGPSADTMLIDAERDAHVHSCLAALDAKQREPIRAAFFEGRTYAELAEAEGVPLGTMKSWIRRGLAKLKACMEAGE